MSAFAMAPLPRHGRSTAKSANSRSGQREHVFGTPDASQRPAMNLYPTPDFPPPDFVAFLAQHCGLSEEDAEHCLENWLDEYYASTNQRAASDRRSSL